MKLNKIITFAFLLAVVFISLLNGAYALGISPGKKTIDFEPKLRYEVKVTLYNNQHKDFRAVIMPEGDLARYIVAPKSIEFSSSENEKSFNYEIVLPESLEKPGIHKGEIVVREIPNVGEEEEIIVDALIAVVSEINVRVPYPGKYAEAELEILPSEDGSSTQFFLRVSNLGKEDIEKAKAFIYIYDLDNKLIKVIQTDSKEIMSMERKELSGLLAGDVSPGNYKATAVLDYDGVIENIEKRFVLGGFFINLVDVSVKNFKLGGIAKFNVLVENIANYDINDALTEMEIYSSNGEKIAQIKSMPEIVKSGKSKELILYWDTEEILEGEYSGKLNLRYDDKNSEKKMKLKVYEDRIETDIFGITGNVVGVPNLENAADIKILDKESLIIIGIVLLVLINIFWIVYFIKSKKAEVKKTRKK